MTSHKEDTATLTARCLCKANIFKAKVPKSELPLQASICHCYSCRHATGTLYAACLTWPETRDTVHVSKLKIFHHFPTIDILFCPTCSAPMFFATDNLLEVFTGVLNNDTIDLVKFYRHIFVGDTLDGGASILLRHNNDGSQIKRFKFNGDGSRAEEVPQDWPPATDLTGYEAKKEDAVPIRCKCRGVNLILHRGDYSGTSKEDLPFNIDPKTHKLLAGFCGCDSCRLQGGIDFFNWTFAEMRYISFGNSGKSFPTSSPDLKRLADDNEPALGTLTYYTSSPGVQRYFCSNCSACIFYAVDSRPQLLDIAIGVLEASDGARAEGLLSWPYGARMSHREDGDGGWRENLFDNVEKAAEEYRITRDYPKNWLRIAKDEN